MMLTKKESVKASIDYRALQNFWKQYTKQQGYADNRRRPNIIIKHSFASACRIKTNLSLNQIASIIDKDHASVVHAMRNHKSNMQFLPTYAYVFEEISNGISHAVDRQVDVYEANKLYTLNALRERLIETSQRLRLKIKEYNQLRDTESKKPLRIQEENEVLKKYNKQLQERNKKLNKELQRLKNLL